MTHQPLIMTYTIRIMNLMILALSLLSAVAWGEEETAATSMPACQGAVLSCAFSFTASLPANDEAFSKCYLHDASSCPDGWTYSEDDSACTNKYAPITSIDACAASPEACDLLSFCELPSDFEPATANSFYVASVLKNVPEADDCPHGWSYKGSNCVKVSTSLTPESFSPAYGSNDDGSSSSNGASGRFCSVTAVSAALIIVITAVMTQI